MLKICCSPFSQINRRRIKEEKKLVRKGDQMGDTGNEGEGALSSWALLSAEHLHRMREDLGSQQQKGRGKGWKCRRHNLQYPTSEVSACRSNHVFWFHHNAMEHTASRLHLLCSEHPQVPWGSSASAGRLMHKPTHGFTWVLSFHCAYVLGTEFGISGKLGNMLW